MWTQITYRHAISFAILGDFLEVPHQLAQSLKVRPVKLRDGNQYVLVSPPALAIPYLVLHKVRKLLNALVLCRQAAGAYEGGIQRGRHNRVWQLAEIHLQDTAGIIPNGRELDTAVRTIRCAAWWAHTIYNVYHRTWGRPG